MRKIAIFLVGILILSGLSVVTVSCEKTDYKKTMLHFSNFQIKERNDGITLELTGANSKLLIKDYYIIPTRLETFVFPFGTEITNVKCTPKNIHTQQVIKELTIAPEPILTGESRNIGNTGKPENPLSVNAWYDYRVGCGSNGNQRNIIVTVEVFPVQFYRSDNLIDWAESVEIEIQYNEPEQTLMSFEEEYDLIVLTSADFSDELSSLVIHKNARGVSTKLVTLDDIYSGSYFPVEGRDNPEKIKYFIKNAIEAWNARYVLLVGGSDKFPTRETHIYVDYGDGDNEVFISDLYYADIYNGTGDFSSWDTNDNDVFGEYNWEGKTDAVDLSPDVYLGRLACVSEAEVTSCVNKIKNYETNEAYTQDWFTRLVAIGGDTTPNDDDDVNEGEYINQAVMDIMDGFIPTKCWASEGTLNTKTPVNDAINDGAGFVCFAGHGNPALWATHPHNQEDVWIPVGDYKNTHVLSLLNGDKLPIVITDACSVAEFNIRDDCFSWSFVLNSKGGGIASIGPAALCWGYDTKYCIEGLGGKINVETFKAYKVHGAFTFGEMWAIAINKYITTKMDGGDYKTIEEWQPFGDPSLAIGEESLPPNTPDPPEGSESGKTGTSYTYSASTTDPEGDQISYLFDWGDGTYSEWTSLQNSGQTVSASHIWQSDGSYEIRVKAKDAHGIQSEWSDPMPITMPYSYRPILQFLESLLEQCPNAFRLLRQFLGY